MVSIRLPDEHIEHLIVYKFLTDGNYIPLIVEYYSKEYYSSNEINNILQILMAYFKKYGKVPDREILNLLIKKLCHTRQYNEKEHLEILDKCINPPATDPKLIKDNIIDFLKSRVIYHTIINSLDDIEKKKDLGKIYDAFMRIDGIDLDLNLGFDFFKDYRNHIEHLVCADEILSTGYSQLDLVCNGGIPKNGKCLLVFIAQSGLGKSLMMSNLATKMLADGKFCLIISFELSEQLYGKRIDAHISGMNINSLRFNVERLIEKTAKFRDASKGGALLIKEYPPSAVNSNMLHVYIDKVIQNYKRKPDIIFVDYINLMQANNMSKGMGMYEKIGDISRELRALSYTFGVPIVSASQVQRSAYNSTDVDMNNTSESMGIVHTADFLGAMWQQEGDREAGLINMTVCKNRFGGYVGKKIQYGINYENLRIDDIQESSEDEDKKDTNSLQNTLTTDIDAL